MNARCLAATLLLLLMPVFLCGKEEDVAKQLLALSPQAGPIPSADLPTQKIGDPQIFSFVMPNGMRIVLRSNQDEENVLMQLFAQGGTWNFAPEQTAAAKYAGTFTLESGLNDISGRELNDFLFRYSMEVTPRTRPFRRHIDCTVPAPHLNYTLGLLHHYFLDMDPTYQGFLNGIDGLEDAVHHRLQSCEARYEDLYLIVNSGGHPAMLPTTEEQIRSIRFEDTVQAFNLSFRDPSEFTLVIAGPIEYKPTIDLILRYLGTIPRTRRSPIWEKTPKPLPFPRGVSQRKLCCGMEEESLARITFPLQMALDQQNYSSFETATQVIEQRLRSALLERYESTRGVDVQYHLPSYPFLTTVWVTIQYRSAPHQLNEVTDLCLEQLTQLLKDGPKPEEIAKVRTLSARMNDYWLERDAFWLNTISNFIMWGWPLKCIEGSCTEPQTLTREAIHHTLKRMVNLSNYTVLTLCAKR